MAADSFRMRIDQVSSLLRQPHPIIATRPVDADPVEDRLELVDVARRAFDWIGSMAAGVDGGLGWLEDGVPVDDLYFGTAGVLLGCAEAAATGLDPAQVSAVLAPGCCTWPAAARAWPRCPMTGCSPGGPESR